MSAAVRSSSFDFTPVLREGDVVTWPQGTGEPCGLTQRLVSQRHALPGVTLFIGMTISDTLSAEHADRFQFRGLNGAGTNRRLAAAGVLDIVPAHVSSVPALIRSRALPVDVLLLRVRPHPKPGYFSVGIMVDFVPAMLAAARCVVAEIDERMPVTSQDALVSKEAIHFLTECDAHEVLMPDPEPSEVEVRVAAQVAALIPDRATLQLGIGGLPVAVCRALNNHRDLGVHSGVIPDGIADLMERGVITNACKGADTGHTVTGGLFGSRRLMDFANGNPLIEMRSAEYTHHQGVMGSINNLYGINSAIEVDLSGQVNSEVAAGRYLGAIGGQADFVRGSMASPGGRSIIALPSTTPDGKMTRIVASLQGGPVTAARADVDMIVTEYGAAHLRGCTLAERARRLAAIAHPAFREQLLAAAVPSAKKPQKVVS